MKLFLGTLTACLLFVVVLATSVGALATTLFGAEDSGESDITGEAAGPTFSYNPADTPTGVVSENEIVSVLGIRVHRSIASNVAALLAAARADGVGLDGWGYRSTTKQIQLRIDHCGGNTYYAIYQKPSGSCNPPTATPGRSQHERGLAIDFKSCPRTSACFRWLQGNAGRFGLKNLPSESWHWSTTGR